MSLLSLPIDDVIIPHILSYLDLLEVWSLRLVCKYLYDATYEYLTRCSSINIEYTTTWSHHLPSISIIFKHTYRLKSLTLRGSLPPQHSIEPCLQSFVHSKPTLIELRLQGVHFHENSTIQILSSCCESLQVLYISSLKCSSDMLDILLKHNTSLQQFCCDNTDISKSVGKILPKQTHLQVLKLSNCLNQLKVEEFNSIMKFKELHSVRLSFISFLTDRSVEVISEFCPQLKNFEMQYCHNISWEALKHLTRKGITVESSSTLPQAIQYKDQI